MTDEITLREYQREAIQCVRSEWQAGNKRTIVCLPTGTGKCVDERTYVWSHGLKRFVDIFETSTMTIASRQGPAVIRGWHDDGFGLSVRVTLDTGQQLGATPETKVLARTPLGPEEWVPMKNLTTQHYLAIPLGQGHFGPIELDPDIAFAMGYFAAGTSGLRTFGDKARTRAATWVLGVWSLDVPLPFADRLCAGLRKWLEEAGETQLLQRVDTSFVAGLTIPTKRLRNYLPEKHPYLCVETSQLRVPPCILEGTRDTVIAYLQGFLRAYCSNAGRGFLRVTSLDLAEQIQQLLLGVGIPVTLRRASGAGAHKLLLGPWGRHFEILGRQWLEPLHLRMLDEEQRAYDDIRTRMGFFKFPMGEEGERLTLRDLVALGLSRAMLKLRTPSQAALCKAIDAVDARELSPELLALRQAARPDVVWGRVESLALGQARHIDVETETDHEYLAAGIATHNTWMFVFMIYGVKQNGLRSCVLVNTDELVDQTIEKLRLVGLEAGVLKASKNEVDKPVVVASIQSLSRPDRLSNLPPNHFNFMITDECHYANSESYQRVLWWFKDAWHLGVTATAFRGDNKSLAKAGWQSVAFNYSIQQAMSDGWLAPAKFITITTETDITSVKRKRNDQTGEMEFVASHLDKFINTPERNELIVKSYLNHLVGRRTLMFCSSVNHSIDVANAFRRRSIEAYSVYGSMKERDRKLVIQAHRQGRFPVLTNCKILTTGYDDPEVSAIGMCSPTESKTLYMQMIGRGLRPWRGKRDCKVLDFVDVSRKFKLATGSELGALESELTRSAKKREDESQSAEDPDTSALL